MNNALYDEVLTYLETLDYSLLERDDGFIVADKASFGGTHEIQQLWVPIIPEQVEDIPHLEQHLLGQFDQGARRYPNANRWIVAHTFGGFSRKFRDEADRFEVKLRVPIQFFDTAFKREEFVQVTESTIEELRRPIPRIPQPYSVGEPQEKGADLFEILRGKYRSTQSSNLRFVVGPAGVGKTWFFRKLFSELYDDFLKHKAILDTFPRPIPLWPESRRKHGAVPRTQDVVREFIDAELATYVRQSTFEWMLTHGYALWLFDGFDELYSEDKEFFNYLADLLTRPGSKAQILICGRESLLSSCSTFADFLENFPPGQSQEPAIELYHLDRWEYPSKRAFAGLHIQNEEKETQFLTYISRSDSLRSLSSLPYYCTLLVEEFKQGNTKEFSDDFALIAYAISGIVKREKRKGMLSEINLQPNGLDEWLETMAFEYYTTNFKGISKIDAEEYATLVLNPKLSEEERQGTITTLVQFPLLARGAETGLLSFEHELIAEYLVGRYWLRRFTNDPARVAHALSSRIDFADSLLARYMADQLPRQPGGIESLVQTLNNEPLPGRDFTVLLQLLLATTTTQDVLKNYRINVEGHDLSQVQFIHRNLAKCSFRGCDLSGAVFQDCNLQNTYFEGAHLRETRFVQLSEESLEEAQFGNLERFESVYIGERRIEDRSKFAEWMQKVTGIVIVKPIQEPCPAFLQLRTLFLKFVFPDGKGRRDEMSAEILVRGKRYPGAPLPEACLEACVRFGYLQPLDWHNRVRRVPGDRYDDVVDFVKNWELSERMRTTLDSLCPTDGCEHVPNSYHTS